MLQRLAPVLLVLVLVSVLSNSALASPPVVASSELDFGITLRTAARYLHRGELDAASRALEQASTIARDDAALQPRVLQVRARIHLAARRHGMAYEDFESSLRQADETGDRVAEWMTRLFYAEGLAEQGDVARAWIQIVQSLAALDAFEQTGLTLRFEDVLLACGMEMTKQQLIEAQARMVILQPAMLRWLGALTRMLQGRILLQQGEAEKACAVWSEAIELNGPMGPVLDELQQAVEAARCEVAVEG